MSACITIYLDNDNLLVVEGVRNKATGEYINDATVQITLRDAEGDPLSGQSFPLTLSYITGSNGNYQGTVEDTLEASNGDTGTIRIQISGDSLTADITVDFVIRTRTEESVCRLVSRSDVEGMLGITMTAAQASLFSMVAKGVEKQIEREIGQKLLQPAKPFVDLLPGVDFHPPQDPLVTLPHYGRSSSFRYSEPGRETLELSQGIVRRLVDVRVDRSRAFGADTALTIGTQVYLDTEWDDYADASDPISMTGIVYRRHGSWPRTPRTIRIEYIAGLTSAELDGDFYDLKFAVMEEVARRFKAKIQLQGVGSTDYPVKSENIGGQHSISYDTSGVSSDQKLSGAVLDQLAPFRRYLLG